MRKIFIDCGGHTGSSVRHFCNTRPDWQEYEIYSFEPDPQHWHRWPIKINFPLQKYQTELRKSIVKEFNVIKKAVWIEDCEKEFFITEANFRSEGGSTLNSTKHNHNYNKYYSQKGYKFEKIKTTCIDIADFIFSISRPYKSTHLVMKLDVEGAEYDIIPHMLANGTFNYIDEFYIEWHNWRAGRCDKPYNVHRYKSSEDLKFESEIKKNYNLDCQFWDAIDC